MSLHFTHDSVLGIPHFLSSSFIELFSLQVRILRGRVVGSQSRSIDRDSCSQQELDYHVRHCELTGEI